MDIEVEGRLPEPVSLAAIKADPRSPISRWSAAPPVGHSGAGRAVERLLAMATAMVERPAFPKKSRSTCYIPSMSSPKFEVVAPFQPAGDQPKAIAS